MLRTARLPDALRGRGKHLAIGLGAAAALAGAGSASVLLTSGAVPPAHQSAPVQASLITPHSPSAGPVHVTQAALPGYPATGAAVPAAHQSAPVSATLITQHSDAATPVHVTHAALPAHAATGAVAPAQAQIAPARPQSAPAQAQAAAAPAQPAAAAPAQPAAAAPQPAPAQSQQPVTQPASQPYQIYDSVTPSSIPAGQQAAVYSDGSYATSASQVAGHPNTLWIDTNGSNPQANALDVEPGDATPTQAGTWVAQKLNSTPNQVAIVYTMRSDWPAVQAAVGQLPSWMQSHVRWWIADPTGVQHMVPGANATQWYWGQNYDISTANPGF